MAIVNEKAVSQNKNKREAFTERAVLALVSKFVSPNSQPEDITKELKQTVIISAMLTNLVHPIVEPVEAEEKKTEVAA